jgi:hypothetical protein
MASERVKIAWFHDIQGNEVNVGDRIAVAVSGDSYKGLRIGEVLEMTGVWEAGKSEPSRVRVKVQVENTSDHAGWKYDPDSKTYKAKPYVQTYDVDKRVVLVD